MSFINNAMIAIKNGESQLFDSQKSLLSHPERVIEKSSHDYQTDIDIRVEKIIGETILSYYPNHSLVGEEFFTEATHNKYQWFIDPIDGTRNFIQGRQDYAISLALYENGNPILGILSFPARNIKIIAEQSIPHVTINGQPVRAIKLSDSLSKALVGIPGDIYDEQNADKLLHAIHKLIYRVEGFRISGALGYDLGCMAIGEIIARLSYKAKPVDVAAGAYIIQKTGGKVTDIAGNIWSPFSGSILASLSCQIHDEILEALNS
jgi:myo-inositol-1(or 4)-monophosphatase